MSIFLYGATGFTGTLIARGLRAEGFDLILSGRDRLRLEDLARDLEAQPEPASGNIELRPARLSDPTALAAAVGDATLILGCAGPFARIGAPLVEAALAAHVPYMDIAGEPAFLREVYERHESEARREQVLIVSGMAFEIALGDFGAHLAARALAGEHVLGPATADDPSHLEAEDSPVAAIDEIAVAYALNRFRTSAGTRMTAGDSLSGPSFVWVGDRWDPIAPLSERRLVDFGHQVGERSTLSFPSGEVITVPRHVHARRVQTYLSLLDTGPMGDALTRVASFLSPVVPSVLRSTLGAQIQAQVNAPPPSADDRKFASFAISCEARRGYERARMIFTGNDPYGLTAAIACWSATDLHQRSLAGTLPSGVRAPAEVFPAEQAIDAIRARWRLDVYRSF